jgi:hypothetical protein
MAAYPGCWDETPDRDYKLCNYCRMEKKLAPVRGHTLCEHHTKMKELESRRQLLASGMAHINPNQAKQAQGNAEPLRYRSLNALT